MSIWERISVEMAEAAEVAVRRARRTRIETVKRGARELIDNPNAAAWTWLPAEIDRIRWSMAVQIYLRDASHPAFDSNRLIALRQAYCAVRFLRFRDRAAQVAADMEAA